METTEISLILPIRNEPNALSLLGKIRDRVGSIEAVIVDTSQSPLNASWNVNDRYFHAPHLEYKSEAMNFGASVANGNILWFLHIDCLPPFVSPSKIADVARMGFPVGIFLKAYDRPNVFLKLQATTLNFLCKNFNFGAVGTNGIFVEKVFFAQYGPWKEWPFLEDVEFMRAASQKTAIGVIDDKIVVSSRKYASCLGLKRILINALVIALFSMGIKPQKLISWYNVPS